MSSGTALTSPTDASRATASPRRRWSVTAVSSTAFTALTIAALVGMVLLFALQSLPVWRHEGTHYLTGDKWFFRNQVFGVLPMLYGTAVVAIVAVLLAAPIGIGAAVFASEYLPPKLRLAVKLTIELLAGVPSVVYGLLGILVLRNYVYDGFRSLGVDMHSGDSLLTAGILLAIMILPTIMTLSDDALRAVPSAQRQAARGLGLTRGQAVRSVALPQARRGLVAAVLLALGRALGEMIAVFLVVGRQDNQLPASWFSLKPLVAPGQTMSSKLGGAETNIAYGDPLHWAAMVGLGLLLMAIVAIVTLVGGWLAGRSHAHA
ncbi:MAG TPA: phosphate ABC transporter permease subunit PstC [Tepidisphaeraceae bacterium]|nr:phosphate ABC transporter permease subunit PstC [Tepidisphaeraceae bacterium]